MIRVLAPAFLLAALASPALAEKDPPPKCTVVKASGKDTSLDVPLKNLMASTAALHCKMDSKKVAEKWVADNAACEPGKSGFKYTVTWGVPGKEKSFELSAYCPKKKK